MCDKTKLWFPTILFKLLWEQKASWSGLNGYSFSQARLEMNWRHFWFRFRSSFFKFFLDLGHKFFWDISSAPDSSSCVSEPILYLQFLIHKDFEYDYLFETHSCFTGKFHFFCVCRVGVLEMFSKPVFENQQCLFGNFTLSFFRPFLTFLPLLIKWTFLRIWYWLTYLLNKTIFYQFKITSKICPVSWWRPSSSSLLISSITCVKKHDGSIWCNCVSSKAPFRCLNVSLAQFLTYSLAFAFAIDIFSSYHVSDKC